MSEAEDRLRRLESEIERRLLERFAGLRDEFDRLRLESDRRWSGFQSRFDQDFSGIVPQELVLPPAGAVEPSGLPARPMGAGLLSIETARNLDDAGNQVEALHRFLELCRRHASRAALLISKSGTLVVWKATGFSDSGGNDEATRRVILPMDLAPLPRVLEGSSFNLPGDNEISVRLGAGNVSAAVLVPMVVKEKVSGAVYADATIDDAGRFDPESIAFLTFLAGLFVDRLAGRKLKPAPALRPLGDPFGAAEPAGHTSDASAAPAEKAPSVEKAPYGDESRPGARESFGTKILSEVSMAAPELPEPAPPLSASSSAPRFSEPDFARSPSTPARPSSSTRIVPSAPEPPAPAPEPMLEPETPEDLHKSDAPEPEMLAPDMHEPEPQEPEPSSAEPSLAYEPDADSSSPRRAPRGAVERPASAAAPVVPSITPPPAAPAAPPAAAPAEVAPVRPTTGTRRLAGPLAPLEGDERREEARRFAKLLVSEIKLYNEKVVLDGRQKGNLYDRLKEDIDRSRQMYDERIPEDVRANTNFFYEELVRILADGRAEALGI